MRRWRRPPGEKHLINEGRVGCSFRGTDVDVETCWMCGSLTGITDDDGDEAIWCRPPVPMDDLSLSFRGGF